jgi:hypothetical protein
MGEVEDRTLSIRICFGISSKPGRKQMTTGYFQEIIDSIESLPLEEQEYLFELICKRRIEKRRSEIASNGEKTLKSLAEGTAKKGTSEDIKAYLLEDEEEEE